MQQAACRKADTDLDSPVTLARGHTGGFEIGAVKIEAGQVVGRFQGLMNPGLRVSAFIEGLTGISNEMLAAAPDCAEVMDEFADFIAGHDLVAHNASFDRRFLDAELLRIGRDYSGEFACSMLAARRVYRDAPDHKLGTLVAWKRIPNDGTFHRALADAEMTAGLWLGMLRDITARHEFANIPFALMQELARVPAAAAVDFLGRAGRSNGITL